MGLGGDTITSWDQMKEAFLNKYQDYCRSRDLKEEIFKMMSKKMKLWKNMLKGFNIIFKDRLPLPYLGKY